MHRVHRVVGGGQRVHRAPGAPMSNGVTVPSSWKTIVAVRLDEKSSTRSMASCTASHPHTA